MKALVKTNSGFGNMELLDVEKPSPKENEALIKVMACGVCGTDIKIFDGEFHADTPVIVGHEFSGIIEAIGDKVSLYGIGDRVVSEQHVGACGKCEYCLSGKRHLCKFKRSPGYLSNGAFAEYITVHENLLHLIPDSVTYDEACLIEPMAIVAHALFEKAVIQPEDIVVILGCGPIALMSLQILKAEGAAAVYMTGLDSDEMHRFKIARELGADTVINVSKEDPVARIEELTGGRGADLVLELSGAQAAILQGLKFLRKDGRFCAIGIPHQNVCVPWGEMVMRAVNVYFSFSSGYRTWERCLSMMQNGKVNPTIFTHDVYTLADWEKAFQAARQGTALKAIIKPWQFEAINP